MERPRAHLHRLLGKPGHSARGHLCTAPGSWGLAGYFGDWWPPLAWEVARIHCRLLPRGCQTPAPTGSARYGDGGRGELVPAQWGTSKSSQLERCKGRRSFAGRGCRAGHHETLGHRPIRRISRRLPIVQCAAIAGLVSAMDGLAGGSGWPLLRAGRFGGHLRVPARIAPPDLTA